MTVITRTVSQQNLSSECWLVQMWGLTDCETCEYKDTSECGGKRIRETGKNALGVSVPIS